MPPSKQHARAMPVCSALDDELDLVYVKPQGVATTQEFIDCIEEYAREPAFHPEIDVLLDFRSMTSYELGEDAAIEQLAATIDQTRDGETGYRMACIVRSDSEETLVSLSESVLYRAGEAESFYEPAEALRWLDRAGAEERVEGLRRTLETDAPAAGEDANAT